PLLQRGGQLAAVEVPQPRPQPDVGGRGGLGLQPGDLLERGLQGKRRPLQQQLAREQRAVQLAGGQDALAHAKSVPRRSSTPGGGGIRRSAAPRTAAGPRARRRPTPKSRAAWDRAGYARRRVTRAATTRRARRALTPGGPSRRHTRR